MLTDFHFYLVAIPAVVLVGLSKGGLGGALALMGVPLMALAVSPVQAAAIFLPILIVMDIVALFAWRHYNHRQTLLVMLPGAIAGIALGWATSSMISADAMRLVVASVTILFVLRYFYESFKSRNGQEIPAKPQRPAAATLWSSLSGYASFVAHAGGPPFQIYVLPLKLDPKTYTGMSVRFFAIMNAIKLIPYFALGALDATNGKLLSASGGLILQRDSGEVVSLSNYSDIQFPALPGGLITPEVTALISNGSAILATANGVRPMLRYQ